MTPWDLIQAIYKKQKLSQMLEPNIGICLTLNKWLAFNPATASIVKNLIPYTFYIEPIHYYYLLFLSIPHQYHTPFMYRPAKPVEEKPNKLLAKTQYVLNWTDREMLKSKDVLKAVVLDNEEHWKKELAVK